MTVQQCKIAKMKSCIQGGVFHNNFANTAVYVINDIKVIVELQGMIDHLSALEWNSAFSNVCHIGLVSWDSGLLVTSHEDCGTVNTSIENG